MDIRSRALHAAATVVLALGASGCFKPTETESPADDSTTHSDDTSAHSDDTSVATDDSTGGDSSESTDDTSVATDDSSNPITGPDCNNAADVTACCEERNAWCGEQYTAGSEEYNTCVFGPNYDGSTGCIPWGPPVPPRLAMA